MAKLGLEEGEYTLALFHCHLAAEKAIKSLYMSQHGEAAPQSHDLPYLAGLLKEKIHDDDLSLLKDLNDFAVQARYSDPVWAETRATKENTAQWVEHTSVLLSHLLDET